MPAAMGTDAVRTIELSREPSQISSGSTVPGYPANVWCEDRPRDPAPPELDPQTDPQTGHFPHPGFFPLPLTLVPG